MQNERQLDSVFILLGHLFFLVYAILCAYFAFERVLYLDTAYQYLILIQTESYQIFTDRYSNIIAQTIPLLAVKLNLSLELIIYIISLSYPIVYYSCFIICIKFFKNYFAATLIPIVLVLNTGWSFFFAINETTQGLVYSTLYVCWLWQVKDQKIESSRLLLHYFIELFIIILCLFTHPITSFTLAYILLSAYILKKINTKKLILSGVLLTIPYVLKLILQDPKDYEGRYFSNFKDIPNIIGSIFDFQGFKFLSDSFMGRNDLYLISIILLIASSIALIAKRKSLIVLFTIFWTCLFIFISIIASYKGHSSLFMEIRFLPTALFISFLTLLAISQLPAGKITKYSAILIFILIGFRVKSIIRFSKKASQRINYIESLCVKNSIKTSNKFIAYKEDLNSQVLIEDWALGAETLLYSNAKLDKEIFITPIKKSELDDMFDPKSKKIFICSYSSLIWNIDSLNNTFFGKFDGEYIFLKKEDL